jgi:hypothetical protein
VDRDTIADVTATDDHATYRERILQTRNGMFDSMPYVTPSPGEQREELAKLHQEGLVELKVMASWNPPVWRSLTEYPDPEAFWKECEVSGAVRVRVVAATEEINAMSPEEQRAAWDEINAWFVARAPIQRRRNG